MTTRLAKDKGALGSTWDSIGENPTDYAKKLTCLQTTSVRAAPNEVSTRLRIPVLLSSEPDVPWASENEGHPVPEQYFLSELRKTFPTLPLLTHKERLRPRLTFLRSRSDSLPHLPDPMAGGVTISSTGILPTAPSLWKNIVPSQCFFDVKGFFLNVQQGAVWIVLHIKKQIKSTCCASRKGGNQSEIAVVEGGHIELGLSEKREVWWSSHFQQQKLWVI